MCINEFLVNRWYGIRITRPRWMALLSRSPNKTVTISQDRMRYHILLHTTSTAITFTLQIMARGGRSGRSCCRCRCCRRCYIDDDVQTCVNCFLFGLIRFGENFDLRFGCFQLVGEGAAGSRKCPSSLLLANLMYPSTPRLGDTKWL